jgi:hypothetical protein
MTICPCCSGILLRHARHQGIYWFCPHCWQEMPDLASEAQDTHQSLAKQPELASQFYRLIAHR